MVAQTPLLELGLLGARSHRIWLAVALIALRSDFWLGFYVRIKPEASLAVAGSLENNLLCAPDCSTLTLLIEQQPPLRLRRYARFMTVWTGILQLPKTVNVSCFCKSIGQHSSNCLNFSNGNFIMLTLKRRLFVPNVILILAWLLLFEADAHGQDFGVKLFEVTSHDFGDVRKGEVPEYRFKFVNRLNEPLHIRSVKSSCGCTEATASQETIQPGEEGEIVCKYKTPATKFPGNKEASINVLFDLPQLVEKQLTVKGNITTEFSFEPKIINFGQVTEGEVAQVKVKLTSKENPRFQIKDVRSDDQIAVDYREIRTSSAETEIVSYELTATLLSSAQKGYLHGEIYLDLGIHPDGSLKTKTLALSYTGRLNSLLQLSKEILDFGTMQPGEVASQKLVLRSAKPFKIIDIVKGDGFSVSASSQSKKTHIIEVTCDAGNKLGVHESKLKFSVEYVNAPLVQTDPKENLAVVNVKTEIVASGVTRDQINMEYLAKTLNQNYAIPKIDLGKVESTAEKGTFGPFDFSPDGSKVLVNEGSNLFLIDCLTGRLIKKWSGVNAMPKSVNPLPKGITAFSFSPDGSIVGVRPQNSDRQSDRLELYDVVSGKPLKGFLSKTNLIGGVVFSNDGRLVATGSENGAAIIWNVPTGELIKTLKLGFQPRSFQFSDDDVLAIFGGGDGLSGQAEVWSTNGWNKRFSVKDCTAIALSEDGNLFATAQTSSEFVKIWDVDTSQSNTLETSSGAKSLDFNYDASKLLVGYDDATQFDVTLFDVKSGEKILVLKGHT